MKGIYKKLILVFVILCILKIAISFLIPSPTMFDDEMFYSDMAKSFNKDFSFKIYESDIYSPQYNTYGESHAYGPLYPIILSIAYVFKNMRIVYNIFKIIGIILSSLIIFPAWLLAKEFLSSRKAYLVAILCGIWPGSFIFSFFAMPENLFYVLVLFTLYFAYKSFVEKNMKWDYLTGIFLGLSYLTKSLGVVLVVSIFLFSLGYILFKKDFSQIKRKIILYIISLLVVLPWLIRNGKLFGWSLSGITGYIPAFESIGSGFSLSVMLYWTIIYLAYLILATGVIIFVLNLISFKNKDEKLRIFSILIWLSIIGFIIFSAIISIGSAGYQNSNSNTWLIGKPLGRFVEICIPLMLILGFSSIKLKEYFYKNRIKYILICSALIISAFNLFAFKLFPVNNISLSYVGFVNLGIKYLTNNLRILIMTIIFCLLPFYLLLIKYLNFKRLFYLVGLFFVMINIIGFSMVYYNSNYRWNTLDQMQLGLWFNDNIGSTNSKILLDKEYDFSISIYEKDMSDSLEMVDRSIRVMLFWMSNHAEIDSLDKAENYDYIVTKKDLNYELVKQIGDFKLYKK